MADRWEYLEVLHDRVSESADSIQRRLTVNGNDGWEAYAVTLNGEYTTYHMKRGRTCTPRTGPL